jgi:hypothetical protein
MIEFIPWMRKYGVSTVRWRAGSNARSGAYRRILLLSRKIFGHGLIETI